MPVRRRAQFDPRLRIGEEGHGQPQQWRAREIDPERRNSPVMAGPSDRVSHWRRISPSAWRASGRPRRRSEPWRPGSPGSRADNHATPARPRARLRGRRGARRCRHRLARTSATGWPAGPLPELLQACHRPAAAASTRAAPCGASDPAGSGTSSSRAMPITGAGHRQIAVARASASPTSCASRIRVRQRIIGPAILSSSLIRPRRSRGSSGELALGDRLADSAPALARRIAVSSNRSRPTEAPDQRLLELVHGAVGPRDGPGHRQQTSRARSVSPTSWPISSTSCAMSRVCASTVGRLRAIRASASARGLPAITSLRPDRRGARSRLRRQHAIGARHMHKERDGR